MNCTVRTSKQYVEFIRFSHLNADQCRSNNEALLFNDSQSPVTFYVYKFIDNQCWDPLQTITLDQGQQARLLVRGRFVKVLPDNQLRHEFLVEKGSGYVYTSDQVVEKVISIDKAEAE